MSASACRRRCCSITVSTSQQLPAADSADGPGHCGQGPQSSSSKSRQGSPSQHTPAAARASQAMCRACHWRLGSRTSNPVRGGAGRAGGTGDTWGTAGRGPRDFSPPPRRPQGAAAVSGAGGILTATGAVEEARGRGTGCAGIRSRHRLRHRLSYYLNAESESGTP